LKCEMVKYSMTVTNSDTGLNSARMKVVESSLISFRALRANKMRSFLTMLGIIIGVASVIAMIAVGAGAQMEVMERIRSLGTNLVMVAPGAAQEGGAQLEAGSRHTLTERDAVAIATDVPLVAAVAPSLSGPAQAVRGNKNWRTTIRGTTAQWFSAQDWPLKEGRYFSVSEETSAGKVAVLGHTVAEKLFGEITPIGQTIRINNTPFDVIGVLREKGMLQQTNDQDDQIFLPIATAKRRVIGSAKEVSRESVDFILVKVASEDAITATKVRIRNLLRSRHWLGSHKQDDFRFHDPTAAMEAQRETIRTVTYLLGAIASISMIVGGISIMNIMLVSVTERTREIGIRMAVGARPRDIRNQFLIEALTICLLGGVIGVLCGIGAAVGIGKIAGWAIFLGPDAVLFALGFASAIGIFFGYYPAIKASRLDPIEALRFE
jgi:putative ABC transport system permease protein